MDIAAARKGDMAASEQAQGKAKTARRVEGRMARYIFSASVILGIVFAAYAFLWLIGRSTSDTRPRLDLPQRTAEQVFLDAQGTPVKSIRLRALRNFTAAYPDSAYSERALESIEALSADEYQGWLTLSDVFYDAQADKEAKQEALESFAGEWDGGTYQEQLQTMRLQLEQTPAKRRTLNTERALAGRQEAEVEAAPVRVDDLAGAAPTVEIYQPAAVLPAAPPKPKIVIVDAQIERDRKPRYPSRALARGVEASVTVSMDINDEGRVKDARIIQAATGRYAREFGISALRAAKRTRFTPKTIDGVPAPTNGYTRKYTFEIEDP